MKMQVKKVNFVGLTALCMSVECFDHKICDIYRESRTKQLARSLANPPGRFIWQWHRMAGLWIRSHWEENLNVEQSLIALAKLIKANHGLQGLQNSTEHLRTGYKQCLWVTQTSEWKPFWKQKTNRKFVYKKAQKWVKFCKRKNDKKLMC